MRRSRGVLAVIVVTFVCAALAPSAASAAPAAPAWDIVLTSQPTNFEAGAVPEGEAASFLARPAYSIFATNIGEGPTVGAVTVTDTLPVGLTPVEPVARTRIPGRVEAFASPCTVAGQTVTCSTERMIPPGWSLQVLIPVRVAATASGMLTDATTVSGGAAPTTTARTTTTVSAATPAFELLPGRSGLGLTASRADGSPLLTAGAHPYQLTVDVGFPTVATSAFAQGTSVLNAQHPRDVSVVLPRGVVFDPSAVERCTEIELESPSGKCPPGSQVGVIAVTAGGISGLGQSVEPIYNLVPPAGVPAELGFTVFGGGIYVHMMGRVRSDGRYELAADTEDLLARRLNPVIGAQVQLWGNPSQEAHDSMRGWNPAVGKVCFEQEVENEAPCPVARSETPLLTMPSACSPSLTTTATIDSWEEPERKITTSRLSEGPDGEVVGVEGCGELQFEPTISIEPEETIADSPTGLLVDLHVPQKGAYGGRAQSTLEEAKVTLPEGVSVDPSAANGLGSCAEAQFDLHGGEPADCPDASKIGSVEVVTPLIDHPLPGAVYVAKPYENPFDSLLAIYIAIHDPTTGVVIKLAGQIEADPSTGQLTTTFSEAPELPFEDFRLDFFGGPRAALKTPATCSTHTSHSELTPWSGTAAVSGDASFPVTSAPGGGGCAQSASAQPNSPSFEAGTTSTSAGAYAPFVLHLSRDDGSQEFGRIETTLPPGLLGRLAGVSYCPEAAIAAVSGRSGAEEAAAPSCPASSEVGRVVVGAGAGSEPYYVTGHAYLAGPYEGAPLSLAIVTPAAAGPYDLGTVVVRAALRVDPLTTQITVDSDPLPRILKGIPLDIRSIAVSIDRGQFTLNPTSCEPMAIGGTLATVSGATAPLVDRFQVAGCSALSFRPKLSLRLIGKTNRNSKPRLRAVLTTKPGEANIARAQVNLPHSEFLEQNHLNQTCTKPVLLEGKCPKTTIYGRAKAWTPLLEKPLEGDVYLVGGFGYKLPALVAELDGQIRVLLVGKVDSGPNSGIRSTFEVVPDAPVSRFMLELKGGGKGLLVNSEPLCSKKAKTRAIVRFVGQNGKVRAFKPKVAASCGKARKKPPSARQRRTRR